jgi:hypothetical protein
LTRWRPYRDEFIETAATYLRDLYRANVPAAAELAEALRVDVVDSTALKGTLCLDRLCAITRRLPLSFPARCNDVMSSPASRMRGSSISTPRSSGLTGAMLFAIDAAHKLGEQGAATQVLRVDENGDAGTAWTYGRDPYPPRS